MLRPVAPGRVERASADPTRPQLRQERVCIERVTPEIDAGRFPIKRALGETVMVEADVFADGHDAVGCTLCFRHESDRGWLERLMTPVGNDRWTGSFVVEKLGRYQYTIEGWVDPFRTWQADLGKRIEAGSHSVIDLLVGADLITQAAQRATGAEAATLTEWAGQLRAARVDELPVDVARDSERAALASRHPDRTYATRYGRELGVVVDRARAAYGAWYELFPRSTAPEPGRHGTLRDCIARLDYVASMGFDVVYLPPVHPIGLSHRKGKNNATRCEPEDVGSPWAIGGEGGGHTDIHAELGTFEDFDALVRAAHDRDLEIALDIAFQCSPDHPWVREHPSWFRRRPDGTVQFAENPPKKYEDIYPLAFDGEEWEQLWHALRDVFLFWTDRGVRIFRVDNPHTKPLRFWEWVIAEVQQRHPDAIFLSEAFTRPTVMYHLAKAGFSQSYTYFTWRNTKAELTAYLTELTRTDVREFFRPNLWPNTPDILPEYLQYGGRPAFACRAILSATLGASYGIYGPAFELCEGEALAPGSEEYLHSEKYQVKQRDLESEWSLRPLLTKLNQARRTNPALRTNAGLRFQTVDNDALLCFSKTSPDRANAVVVVANLDPTNTQSGWVSLELDALGLRDDVPYQMHDLLSEARYLWHGPRNYVELDPRQLPAHVFRIRKKTRSERDFDYFL